MILSSLKLAVMELKDLHKATKDQLSGLLPLDNPGFRLEQADYNKKTKNWEIVISFLVEKLSKPLQSDASLAEEPKYEKTYKIVKINESGEVLGFYMYNG
jgi:hypothetical protein